MSGPYTPDALERNRRRLLPGGGRTIADALGESLPGATSFTQLDGPVALPEEGPGPRPRPALPSLAPEAQARARTRPSTGLEDVPFVPVPRSERMSALDLISQAAQHPDVTRTPATREPPRPTTGTEGVNYRDPMMVAKTRAVLQRIAAGKRPREDGTPYTPEEREQAAAFDENLRARIEREEAKGGFGRRVANEVALGAVNAPYQREINAARERGEVVSDEDLRQLGVTVGNKRLRTEPTLSESLREDVAPALVGQLPYFVAGAPLEDAALRAGGEAMAGRAPGVSRGIARLLSEPEGTFLERTGQRAAKGAVLGQPTYAALDITRRAEEGEHPGDIAAGVPLDLAAGAAMGAVAEPLFGAAGEAIRKARSAAERMASARPHEQADAVHQMAAAQDVQRGIQMVDAETARQHEHEDIMERHHRWQESLYDSLMRAREESRTPEHPHAEVAQAYQDAVDKMIDAEASFKEASPEQQERGTRPWINYQRALRALNEARERYGRQAGAAAVVGLAANNSDLTDDEKRMVGLGAMALTTERARSMAGELSAELRGRLVSGLRGALAEHGGEPVTPHELVEAITQREQFTPEEVQRTFNILHEASNDQPTDHLTTPGAIRLFEGHEGQGGEAAPHGNLPAVIAPAAVPATTEAARRGLLSLELTRRFDAIGPEDALAMSPADWMGSLARSPQETRALHQVLVPLGKASPDGLVRADDLRRALMDLPDQDNVGRAPLRSRLIDTIDGLKGPAWEKPRPAADWIGKLKGSNAISKQELNLLMPRLEAAQASKEKLTRDAVLSLAKDVVPMIDQATLEDVRRPAAPRPGANGDAGNLLDIEGNDTVIPAELRGDPDAIQEQIDNRHARLAEIDTDIADRQRRAQAEVDEASDAEARRYHDVQQTVRNMGFDRGVIDPAIDYLNENIEGEYIPRGAVDKAFDQIAEDLISPDSDKVKEIFKDADYTTHEVHDLVGTKPDGSEAFREEVEPGESAEDVTARVKENYEPEEGESWDDLSISEEPTGEWLALDGNNVERARESDEFDAIQTAVAQDDLDANWRDEFLAEVKQDLENYAEARSEYLRVESENYGIINDDNEFFDDEHSEQERLRDEIARLTRWHGEETERANNRTVTRRIMDAFGVGPRDDQALEAAGQLSALPTGEMADGTPAPPLAEDPYLMPLAPEPRGSPQYSTYQRIGGGRDYAELVNVWANPPAGTEFTKGHFGRSANLPNDVGHIRVETHDVPTHGALSEPGPIPHVEGESDGVRLTKDAINLKRRERDKLLAEMTDVARRYDALPADQQEGSTAQNYATRYEDLNQQAIHLSKREDELLDQLAGQTNTAVEREPVRVMIESQSDWAQHAYNEGIAGGDEQATRAKIEELKKQDGALADRYNVAREKFMDLMKAMPQGPDDPALHPFSIYTDYGPEDTDLAHLRNTYGESHPELVRLADEGVEIFARKAELQRAMTQLRKRLEGDIPRSPFLTERKVVRDGEEMTVGEGGPAFMLNAARYLIDSAERGYERIAWSDGANRVKNAHLPMMAAVHTYDEATPSAIRKLLGGLGFKDVPITKLFIRGEGHWQITLTPEMRRAIRKVGLPILGLLAVAAPDQASAQEPDDSTGVSEVEGAGDEGHPVATALVTGLAAMGITAAALRWAKLHPRVPLLREPAVEQALALARQAEALTRESRGRVIPEARGTGYKAPLDVSETPSGKGAALLNLAKIGVTLSDEGGQIMRGVTDKLAMQKRHVTWSETEGVAAARAQTPADLLNQKPWTGADALAARMFQKESVDQISALAQQARAALISPEEKARIGQRIATLTADLGDVTRRAIGEREAAGRTLNAYKIVARTTLDEATWAMLAQRAKRLPLTDEEVVKIKGLLDAKDRAGLTQFVSNLHRSTKAEKAIEALRLGFLSKPTTVLKITASHAIHTGFEMAKQPVALGLDVLITGLRRIAGNPQAQREMALAIRGSADSWLRGARAGVESGKQVLRTGVKASDEGRFDTGHVTFSSPWAQAIQRWIYGAHALGYEPFRMGYFEHAVNELSLVKARQLVRANPSLDLMQVREALVQEPTADMMATALDEANRVVFQNKGTIAAVANAAKRTLKEKGGSAGTIVGGVVTPFTTIPANIASRMVDATPLGFLTAWNRQTRMGFNQRRLAQDLSGALVGTAGLMAAGYMLYGAGKATGSFPDSPSKKNLWLAENKQAAAIRIGDQWVNISEYGPEGMAMALGAAWAQAVEEQPDWADRTGAALGAVGKTIVDVPFLTGISEALNVVQDPAQYGGSWAKSLAGAIVPAGIRGLAHATDPMVRDASGPGQQIAASIPGVSRTVAPKVDAMGREQRRSTAERVGEMVSPTRITTAHEDPVTREFERLGLGIPAIPKTRRVAGKTIQYPASARREASAATGPEWRAAVIDTLLSDSYQSMDDDEKAKTLRNVIQHARRGYYAPQDSAVREMQRPPLLP